MRGTERDLAILTRRGLATVGVLAGMWMIPGPAWGQAEDVDCKKCVDKKDIAKGAITSNRLKDSAVTEEKIRTGAVTESKLSELAVVEGKIGDGAVSEAKIADTAVSETKLVDGAVSEVKLGDGAVSEAKIGDAAVGETKIAEGAVVESKLADGAVSEAKIAEAAVGESKLADGAASEAKIADGAVTPSKLSDDVPAAVSSSAEALRSSNVDLPQSTSAVMLALDPDLSDVSTGFIEVPFDGHLLAMVAFRLTPTGSPATAQCRLFRVRVEDETSSSMTNYIPRIPVPDGGVATSLVGASRVEAGVYDVDLRCGAGFSGTSGPPLVTLEEAQLIVWVAAL